MSDSIIFNGTTLDGWQDDVYFNGSALATNKRVYFNGTEVWRKHEFEPDSVVIDYEWNPDSNIAPFISTYGTSTYANVFAVSPFFYQGSGGADSRIEFTLADDFRVSYYHKDIGGTDPDGAGVGNTGGVYRIWMGRTVTGLESYTYSLSVTSSNNGNSIMRISYVPYE